ncbi:uncharacterized protein LOC134280359 [Saccostrea cucullata]|uniref:uncharacterized protein LOC134280359 n=1 Tax=Saccostrea cuccullata TaxID=36930 RepID=UPI002ED1ED05
MDHIPRLSQAVYVGLCHEIGSPTEVRIRREVMDTNDAVNKSVFKMRGYHRKFSGSRCEGFRLITSDVDLMMWPLDHKVICDLSQISLYRIPQQTVILMVGDDLPPGFTRLNLMSTSHDKTVSSSCVFVNDKDYISSTLFRKNNLQRLQIISPLLFSSITHGPCSSSIKDDNCEGEILICLLSHHWPIKALPWIQRCHQLGWPSESVVSDILNGGFHVVPIGSTPYHEEEWRISFSQAEEKIVWAMNHSQFLCYGLLKFFLKEVINSQNNNSILCSYFIKTSVFWVIQSDSVSIWKEEKLLFYFWKCFKLLIYWVRIGECPNFFIPQNNMFRIKVTGSVQKSLFSRLYQLYREGISCLLLSPTLRPYLSQAIVYRTLRFCTDESSIITNSELETSFFAELNSFETNFSFKKYTEVAIYMNQIGRLIRKKRTLHQAVILQYITSCTLRNSALLIQNITYPNTNRTIYISTGKVSSLLKLSCTIGCASEMLYLSVYFYRIRMYERSLSILQKAQGRMSVPYIVYGNIVDRDMYRRYTAGMSLGKKIGKAVVFDTLMYNDMLGYINELVFEQNASNKNGMTLLNIPPRVMLHMLFILNHHRLGDTVRSQQSLQDLHSLLLYDDGVNVPLHLRDISWQILGICQQTTGDYSGSLQSYQYSLQQYPFNKIQEATLFRMNTLPNGAM